MVHTSLYWFLSFVALGVLVILLRWAFSRGQSLVAMPGRRGGEDEYGLLIPISAPENYIEGELIRHQLEDAGIRASLVTTLDGPRVMVFPKDQKQARKVLAN